MKRALLILAPTAAIVMLLSSYSLLSPYSGSDSMYPSGAPAGYTGSPGDGQNCSDCHGGSVATVQNWITSDVPQDGYIPGQTYTITATSTGSGKKGFEVSPQNQAGDQLGTLTAGSGEKLVGSGKYVTHTSSSNSNPKVWTFQWTAPVAGTGDVTMYGAFALNTSSTKLSTLVIAENIGTGIPEASALQLVRVFPNPSSKDLNVSFKANAASNVTVSLVNAGTGAKTVLSSEFVEQGSKTYQYDISGKAPGLYLLVVNTGDQQMESKVLIGN
jgi:hypothetical protein